MTEAHEPAYVREHGPLETPVRHVRLSDELASLKREPAWERGERVAKTLVKEQGLNAVLTAIRAGTALHEHRTEGPVTIHCIAGRIDLTVPDGTVELVAGDLVALDGGVRHSVHANEESAILVTLAR